MNEDNVKGELIKKKDSTPSKKKLVIKKVKKVIIKKTKTKDEEENAVVKQKQEFTKDEYKKPVQQNQENFQQNNFKPRNQQNNNQFKKQPYINRNRDNDNKPKDHDKHKKIFFKSNYPSNRPQQNRPFDKNFRKVSAGGKQQPAATKVVVQKNDKERSRKKVNKKDEGFNKKFEKKEEFQKVFNVRKQKQAEKLSSIPQEIDITDAITISDLAKKMNLKANVIISKLMELGTMVTINDTIDAATAEIVCSEFNCKVKVVSLYDETVIEEEVEIAEDLRPRSPIVTVMGHVDHGKTKLLDAIRSTDVVSKESGGITQHIGAYKVNLPNNHQVTFIDTPGHQAFTTMRARGANVTDIVVLVVAADDGVMPQTIEAINHAKAAKVPIVVAINKIDKPDANPDRVKQQLSEYELLPEDWGGHTLYVEISALKKTGIDKLLETLLLQAEMLELKASYKVRASGFVLESKIEPGRGVVSTILILKGVLKIGDVFVAGVYAGRIRAMYDDKGNKIEEALPATPVEITGIEKSPNAGDPFNVTKTEKEARIISAKRLELKRQEEASSVNKVSLKDILAQKPAGEQQELKIIIKADVQGSVEAIKDSLEKLSNREIKIITIASNVGAINESDVMLAVASKAIIIGFHVRPNPKASELADKEKIEIKRYNIIYDVIEDVKASMTGMIKPDLIEELLGTAEVRQIFKISKVGTIAGCFVTKGKIKRKSLIRLIREDVVIYSGKINTLKRFKDDADEVLEGVECGIGLENYKDLKEGDIMEAYEIKEVARKIEDIQ